jgi:FAD/FMN-containing dehydrogenase
MRHDEPLELGQVAVAADERGERHRRQSANVLDTVRGVRPTVPDVRSLAAIVGPEHVLTEADLRAGFEVDWTGRFRGEAVAVVRPGSTAEVAAVLAWCHEQRVPVVPQGGNTGLVAGSVPPAGAIVLALGRLAALGEVDRVAGQITAGAGATLAALHTAVAGSGWAFGVDLGARDTATIGGMIATNAGGIRVLRHGGMRQQVTGVEAVLADGGVLSHLGGLVKDNTGYDLAGLLTGSEGTLAVVTAARLRLVPDSPDRLVALVGLDTVEDALALAAELRARLDGLDALEAVFAPGLTVAGEELGLGSPFATEPAVTMLVEWAGHGDPPLHFGELLGDRPQAVAADASGRQHLWALRERQAEAIARVGIPHKLDVTLPLARLAAFVNEVRTLATASGWIAHLFGHLGDGNLHVNVTGPAPDDDRVDDAVLRLVAGHGGSISAEHGIGRAKARWLHLVRSEAEIAAFRAIKSALDPRGILNPGVLLPEA